MQSRELRGHVRRHIQVPGAGGGWKEWHQGHLTGHIDRCLAHSGFFPSDWDTDTVPPVGLCPGSSQSGSVCLLAQMFSSCPCTAAASAPPTGQAGAGRTPLSEVQGPE